MFDESERLAAIRWRLSTGGDYYVDDTCIAFIPDAEDCDNCDVFVRRFSDVAKLIPEGLYPGVTEKESVHFFLQSLPNSWECWGEVEDVNVIVE